MQFVLLAALWWLERSSGSPTQAQLAAQAGTDQMMTSQVTRRLEQRGLLERAPDRSDARARRLALTAAGRAILAGALADVEAADAEFFAVLGGGHEGFLDALVVLGGA